MVCVPSHVTVLFACSTAAAAHPIASNNSFKSLTLVVVADMDMHMHRFTLHSIHRSTTEVGPTIGHRRRLLFSESNAACHHMQHVRTSS